MPRCLVAREPAHAAVWTPIQSGTTDDITAIEFQSPKRAWFTTATGAIYTRRADGSFLATRTPSGIPLRDIEFQPGGLVGLAGGDQGQLLRSDDGGLSWKPVESVYASGATPQELAECSGSLIGDIRRIRFSGLEQAILFGTGGQVAVSAESIATVGRAGTTLVLGSCRPLRVSLESGATPMRFSCPKIPIAAIWLERRGPPSR